MDLVLTISQTLGRALVFAISFDPHSEISFITPILQMRKWRLREVSPLPSDIKCLDWNLNLVPPDVKVCVLCISYH